MSYGGDLSDESHRFDAYTVRVQGAQPYLRLSRSDVLRMLLDKDGVLQVAEQRRQPRAD